MASLPLRRAWQPLDRRYHSVFNGDNDPPQPDMRDASLQPQPDYRSQAERFSESLIEAGWLVALVVVPLHFNVYSNTTFEPDKAALLRSLALLTLGAWAVCRLLRGREPARRADANRRGGAGSLLASPFGLAGLAVVLSLLLSATWSVAPRISWWGSYERQQGVVTVLCYVAFFFAVATHLRSSAQWARMAFAIVLSSLPAAGYAIAEWWDLDPVAQRLGLDALAWGIDAQGRSSSTLGNPIFLGGYLGLTIFVTLERIVSTWTDRTGDRRDLASEPRATLAARWSISGLLALALVAQFAALLVTQSRGPTLALLAGFFFFSLLGLLALPGNGAATFTTRSSRWLWCGPLIVVLVGAAFMALTVLPDSPFITAEQVRSAGRLATTFDPEIGTTRLRLLIWQGVSEMLSSGDSWLAGSGPETFRLVFGRFYPPGLSRLEDWRSVPDRAHNEIFDVAATQGAVGLAAYLTLYGVFLYGALRWLGLVRRRRDSVWLVGGLSGGAFAGVLFPRWVTGSFLLSGVGLVGGALAGLTAYLIGVGVRRRAADNHRGANSRTSRLLVVTLTAAAITHLVEAQFGVPVTTTQLLFWVFLGVLAAVVQGRLVFAGAELDAANASVAVATPARRASASHAAQSGAGSSRRCADDPGRRLGADAHAIVLGLLVAVVWMTLAFGFTLPRQGGLGAVQILAQSLAGRAPAGSAGWLVPALVGAAWLWGGAFCLATAGQGRSGEPVSRRRRTRSLGAYAIVSLAVVTPYLLLHAGHLARLGELGEEGNLIALAERAARAYGAYHAAVLSAAVLLGGALGWRAPTRRRPVSDEAAGGPAAARRLLASLAAAVIVVVGGWWLPRGSHVLAIRSDILFKQGRSFAEDGLFEPAVALFEQALGHPSADDGYLHWLGRTYMEWGRAGAGSTRRARFDAAVESFEVARQLNPLEAAHPANLGRLFIVRSTYEVGDSGRQEELRRAETFYRDALDLYPNSARYTAEFARLAVLRGESDLALERFRRSLELDPTSGETYLWLARFLAGETGDPATAPAADDESTTRPGTEAGTAPQQADPADLLAGLEWVDLYSAYTALTSVYVGAGRLEEAIATARRLVELRPDTPLGYRSLAHLYLRVGETDLALQHARRAWSLSDDEDRVAIEEFIAGVEAEDDARQ